MMRGSLRRLLFFMLFLLWVLLAGCGGGGDGSNSTQSNATSGENVQSIAVDGGPTAGSDTGYFYPNAAFTSVTVCIPGTSNCQTIDGVLVDTGSTGLRLFSPSSGGALTLSLPTQTTGDKSIHECIQFVDGSYAWGSVHIGDVKLAGKVASSVPIHVIEHNLYAVPTDCSSSGGLELDLQNFGANGILGVGQYQHDCGTDCVPTPGSTLLSGPYYACSSTSGCRPVFVTLAQQVQNPVALFPEDNNGVIIQFPPVSGAENIVKGSMIFGIGTQANNALGNATVLTLNQNSAITTIYHNQSLSHSFLDTGSNGYFFPDETIPQCTGSYAEGFYCPHTPLDLSATNQGANGTSSSVSFRVDNASALVISSSINDYFALSDLAGPNTFPNETTDNTQSSTLSSFIWGLPFFYGRTVYTAIEGKDTPAGPGPYWAY